MAENFTYTPGIGGTGAADDIAAVKYPYVKLTDGTADATAPIAADIGVKANALRVCPANNITDATYIGDIKFGEAEPNSAAILTALEIMDDWDDGNYCNVNLNIQGTDVSANAGVLTAQTLRVTIATDDEVNNLLGTIDADTGAIKTAVELVDNAVYVDDADWTDNTSSHLLVGGIYQSAPHTVTDGDVSPFQLDVNGKIIESNSGAIKTALEIIDDWDDANFCNMNLNFAGTDAQIGEGNISASTLRVTIATDDDGVAHLATIAGDTTNIETAIQIMDDWDATHASAAPADGCQVMGAAYSTALPTDVGADGDAARFCTDRHGRIVRGLMPQWFNAIFDSANASAEGNTVKAKTAARKIYILSLTISVDAEMWVKLQKEDSTAITPKFWLKAGGGLTKTYPPEAPLVLDTVNVDLEVITEGAGNIGVEVTGYLAV